MSLYGDGRCDTGINAGVSSMNGGVIHVDIISICDMEKLSELLEKYTNQQIHVQQ